MAGKKVKLVYASACQTAATGPASIFTGLGPGLLVAGVPAIVSMQFSVGVNAAEKFLERFYRSVGQGKPLADCLADARQLLFNPIFGHAWATPSSTCATATRPAGCSWSVENFAQTSAGW
ncbi:MAG: CHAT domain-containing protein [Anaerolineae bacterium]|nr:MAG: CHAT domain-containing protein [Anaerolineae bacterium]